MSIEVTETTTDYERGYSQGYRDEMRGRAVSFPVFCSAAFAHGYGVGVEQAVEDRYLYTDATREG